jgi:hypothetical protein
MTTVLNINYFNIKWNTYLNNLEFATLSPDLFTFWRINSTDSLLQYQHGDIESQLDSNGNTYVCMDYTPPLSFNCVILLLLCLSDGSIIGVDTKTNSVNIKFPNILSNICDLDKESLHEKLIHISLLSQQSENIVKKILCSLKWTTLFYKNKIRFYKLPFLKDINYDNLNVFQNKFEEIELDSEIISLDCDLDDSCGIVLTKKATLYLINFEEKCAIKTLVFIDRPIKSAKLISSHNFYSQKEIDYENLQIKNQDKDRDIYFFINNNNKLDILNGPQYFQFSNFLITIHDGGSLRVWQVDSNKSNYNFSLYTVFENPSEEVLDFDINNQMKLAVSYSSGIVRFFDLLSTSFLGKYKSLSLQAYKHVKFLPDGEFLFLIDLSETIYLLKIEKLCPLLIQIHTLFNVSGSIIEIQLHPNDTYNKFLLNIQNVYLQIHNRKFTNILKNISYDSSLPTFYLQDKFNIVEFFKNNFDKGSNISNSNIFNKVENFHFEFSPNIEEKSLVYILSEGRKLVLIRNFEKHTIDKVIALDSLNSPINILISPDWSYKAILYETKIEISQVAELEESTGKSQPNRLNLNLNLYLPIKCKEKINFICSQNGRLIIVYSQSSLLFYKVNNSFNLNI